MAFSDNLKSILSDFINLETIQAIQNFTETSENDQKSVDLIAKMFGFTGKFSLQNQEFYDKLTESFTKNLKLLIEKTWVEKSDIAVKQQILYQLENLFSSPVNWQESYETFLEILDAVVFLMFGQQAKAWDFCEYSLRIDPEFGIFWCYVQNLPKNAEWSQEKYKNAVLLGMYFLANY